MVVVPLLGAALTSVPPLVPLTVTDSGNDAPTAVRRRGAKDPTLGCRSPLSYLHGYANNPNGRPLKQGQGSGNTGRPRNGGHTKLRRALLDPVGRWRTLRSIQWKSIRGDHRPCRAPCPIGSLPLGLGGDHTRVSVRNRADSGLALWRSGARGGRSRPSWRQVGWSAPTLSVRNSALVERDHPRRPVRGGQSGTGEQ